MISSLFTIRPHRCDRSNRNRRGTAVVDYALCIPLITAVMFGVYEIYSAVFLDEALEMAAFEDATMGHAMN